VAINLLCAKSKRCILNVSPAGCGKSAATDTVHTMLGTESTRYTSLTLASLHRRKDEFTSFHGHLVIDDLGGEKSLWSRLATITVLANLVHTHYVQKIMMSYEIKITDFQGSASLNIQPVMLNSLIQSDDWVAVVRDKVMRYYHLIRPIKPKEYLPAPETEQERQNSHTSSARMSDTISSSHLSNSAGYRLGRTIRPSQNTKSPRSPMVPTSSDWINTVVTCTVFRTHTSITTWLCGDGWTLKGDTFGLQVVNKADTPYSTRALHIDIIRL